MATAEPAKNDYGWRNGTSTCVQPGRPDKTQSWFFRICAIALASQMPANAKPMHAANARTFMVMRWR